MMKLPPGTVRAITAYGPSVRNDLANRIIQLTGGGIIGLTQSSPNWRMSRLREISARTNAPLCCTFSTITT